MMKLSTAASKVLALGQAIRDYWETELPKRHPHYPFEYPGEDSGPPPPEVKKLRQLLTRLPPDTLYKVALITFLGRGDFTTSDLPSEYQALREEFTSPSEIISQIVEIAALPDYLERGMAILDSQHIDLDKMDLDTAKAGK